MAKDEFRPDIARAASVLTVKLGGKREMRKLIEHLAPDETVDRLAVGTYGGGTGLLALTDRRMLFIKSGMMSSANHDFPLASVASVSMSNGPLTSKIIIHASGSNQEIINVAKADAKAIVEATRAAMGSSRVGAQPPAPSPPSAAPPPAQPDRLEQLKQLGELKAAGVLTEEEFAAEKAKILGTPIPTDGVGPETAGVDAQTPPPPPPAPDYSDLPPPPGQAF